MIPFPILPQRGGTVQPKNVVGRDNEIEDLWKFLAVTGFVLFAERRFGKSSLIRKMAAEGHSDFVVLYAQIQSIDSGNNLVDALNTEARLVKVLKGDTISKLQDLFGRIPISVTAIGSIGLEAKKQIWQQKLTSFIETVLAEYPDKIFVIFLDEFSLMLDKMEPAEAANIISFLRQLVASTFSTRLRFAFAGSIGIDLVLDKIEAAGHMLGSPLNQMEEYQLESFDEQRTFFFCKCLEMGVKKTLDDTLRSAIYRLTNGIPFFIDRIFSHDQFEKAEKVSIELLEKIVMEVLTTNKNNEALDHFYDRIERYYKEKEMAYSILDLLSQSEGLIMTELEIISKLNIKDVNDRGVKEMLDKLRKDNYLKRSFKNDDRCFTFRYNLIRRWWKINKA